MTPKRIFEIYAKGEPLKRTIWKVDSVDKVAVEQRLLGPGGVNHELHQDNFGR